MPDGISVLWICLLLLIGILFYFAGYYLGKRRERSVQEKEAKRNGRENKEEAGDSV